MASEFDTIDELRDDLWEQATKARANNQLSGAYDALVSQLVEASDLPLPQGVIDEEIAEHLRQEGKEADDPHGEEFVPTSKKRSVTSSCSTPTPKRSRLRSPNRSSSTSS